METVNLEDSGSVQIDTPNGTILVWYFSATGTGVGVYTDMDRNPLVSAHLDKPYEGVRPPHAG